MKLEYYNMSQPSYIQIINKISLCTLGVMLSHDNVTWSSRMAIEHYNWNQERLLSYLPLSHVAACLIDCYMSMYAATEIHFADQEALKGTLVCIF